MRRSMFKSKLHRVRITEANLDYEGSVTIDEDLMRVADILTHEKVHIWNVSNGSRLETYVIPGPAGSGVICLNGAAARLAQSGDLAIIASFADMDEEEAKQWEPIVVRVDDNNKILSTAGEKWAGKVLSAT